MVLFPHCSGMAGWHSGSMLPLRTGQNRNSLLVGCTLNVTLFYVSFKHDKTEAQRGDGAWQTPVLTTEVLHPSLIAANSLLKGPAAHTPIILTFER